MSESKSKCASRPACFAIIKLYSLFRLGSNVKPKTTKGFTLCSVLLENFWKLLLLALALALLYLSSKDESTLTMLDSLGLLISALLILFFGCFSSSIEQCFRVTREQQESSDTCCVVRDGKPMTVDAENLVVGDVIEV